METCQTCKKPIKEFVATCNCYKWSIANRNAHELMVWCSMGCFLMMHPEQVAWTGKVEDLTDG